MLAVARRFVSHVSLLCAFVTVLCTTPRVRAQDVVPPEVENSKYQFVGAVNSNAVFVRSGPSENDYATMKLDKGAEVKVVGIRFEWLKVVPPEGSFCYVAKAFIDRRGAGNVGRVTQTLNVRIGSQLNELKAKIATKLEPGVDVEIVGEEQEYFKIKPPAGVFFYINKQYVEPVRQVALDSQGKEVAAPPTAPDAQPQTKSNDQVTDSSQQQQPQDAPSQPQPSPAEMHTADASDMSATSQPPTTQPGSGLAMAEANTPTTSPAVDSEREFDRLEGEYAEASLKPLEEQPVAELLQGYKNLAAGGALPESMRRIAEFKSQVLQTRMDAKNQLVEAKKVQDDMHQKQMALTAEQRELEGRIKQTELAFYTAVGTLRPSSLQFGKETLYRLTDPANGRTVVYLRSNDEKMSGLIGQFIGVKGEIASEQQLNLRVITPTACEMVNPAKVGQSVAAQIVPPSLMPGGAQAQTDVKE